MDRRNFVKIAGATVAIGTTGCLHGGGENGDDGEDDGSDDGGDDGSDDGGEGYMDFETVSEEPDYGGYLDDADSYQDAGGTADFTGQDEVAVGAGNSYTNQFVPGAIQVDPGTTVVWEWNTRGHNVVRATESGAIDAPDGVDTGGEWAGDSSIENPPHEYEHTFEESGVYLYGCEPHISLGMKGAVVVEGDGGSGDGEETDDGMNGNESS